MRDGRASRSRGDAPAVGATGLSVRSQRDLSYLVKSLFLLATLLAFFLAWESRLAWVRVFKFRMVNQLTLLAYEHAEERDGLGRVIRCAA